MTTFTNLIYKIDLYISSTVYIYVLVSIKDTLEMEISQNTAPTILPTPQILSSRQDKQKLYFTIANVDTSIVNGLRRLILNDIPTIAMKVFPHHENQIEILTNTTRHTNEIIKQRLGCVPVHITDMSTPYQQLILEVNKQNDTDSMLYVSTDDFELINEETDTKLNKEEVHRIFPRDELTKEPILIARLRPKVREDGKGEHLHFRAKFSIVSGKQSGMYVQASTCAYGMSVDPDRQEEAWDRELAHLREDFAKQGTPITDAQIEFERENWFLGKGKRITIPDQFDFVVETVGVYSNNDLVRIACQSMQQKLDIVRRNLSEQTLPIQSSMTTLNHGFDITLENEDYTLGKAFEYALYKLYYEGMKERRLTYVGFRKEHPHDPHSIIRIGLVEQTTVPDIIQMLTTAVNELSRVFDVIRDTV